jgi:hypothetical protein
MPFEDAWQLAVEMVMRCAREADGEFVDDSDLVAFTAYRPTYKASYLRLPQPKPAYDPKVQLGAITVFSPLLITGIPQAGSA